MDRKILLLETDAHCNRAMYALAIWQCGLEEEAGLPEGSRVGY
jgi:hypothetical protein